MTMRLTHPYFTELRRLGLPANDFAVFGSGPLVAHGVIFDCNDLDIVARGFAWTQAMRLGRVGVSKGGSPMVTLADGKIEVFNEWLPGEWDVNRLIDEAEVIEGIRFVPVEQVLKWKQMRNLPEDGLHISRIKEYFSAKSNAGA